MIFLKKLSIIIYFWVHKRNDVSFMRPKRMFDGNAENNHFGGYQFYVYLPIIRTSDNSK